MTRIAPERPRGVQVSHCYFEGCRYYTPLCSDPPLGRYDWTRVIDITTGQEQPHVYNGERVRLPARTRARYAVEGAAQGERDRATAGAFTLAGYYSDRWYWCGLLFRVLVVAARAPARVRAALAAQPSL